MAVNEWHKSMYDADFATRTIGSASWRAKSKKEAEFLMSILPSHPEARWLDVPCGTGRHAILFARAGYSVTAIDINSDCLRIAKANNAHRNVKYKLGNMADLRKFRNQFDVVTNLFTSFGYFSTDAENEKVLRGLVACLKPKGKIAINTINRDFLMTIYDPARWSDDGEVITIEASKFDPVTKYNEAQVAFINKRTGRGHSHYHRVRLYSKAEMVSLLKKVGLRRIRVYGDFSGGSFDRLKSTHPIYVGELCES